MKKRIISTCLFALALSFLSGCGKPDVESIKIAAVAPLTGSQGEVGQDLINGISMAVEEANAAGGVLGKKIELVVMDDKADPKEAASVANKLISSPDIVGVVGHMNSGTTLPVTPIYGRHSLPIVMPVPTNPTITRQGLTNLFRIPATDSDQGPACAEFAVQKLGKKRIAVIHDKTAYGQGIAEEFKKRAESLGVQLLLYEGITEGDKDFSPVLSKLKPLNPEVLFFGGIYNEGGLIAKQAKELGIQVIFMAADGCFGGKFVELAGNAGEGSIMSFIAPPWDTTPSAQQFVNKFKAKYGAVKSFAPLGFDAANILIAGIRRAGKADKHAVIGALRASDFFHDGVVGRTSFDERGDNKSKKLYFYIVEKGEFKFHSTL
jgi:branched-chain amino acid transport system substrate-binding protein